MTTRSPKIIEFQDGISVEVEVSEKEDSTGGYERISGNSPSEKAFDSALDTIKPIILKTIQPVTDVWESVEGSIDIDQVEIEIAFSFKGTGSIYVAKLESSANLKITLKLKPKTPAA